jgi:hypothetical protein
MPTDNEYYNRAYFWFDPWRYCNYCQTSQGDRPKRFKYSSDDYTNVSKIKYGSNAGADGGEQDDEPGPNVGGPMDRYEQDDRREKDDARKGKSKSEKKDRQEVEHPKSHERPAKQKHVHEFEGSTKLADFEVDAHNHRIAGITGEAVHIPGGHAHKIWTRTDFFDHFHYIQELSGPAVYLDQGNDGGSDGETDLSEQPHVHFVTGLTSINDGHSHEYQFATLMDAPLLPEEERA